MAKKTISDQDQLLIQRSVKREPVVMFNGVVEYVLRELVYRQEDLNQYLSGHPLIDLASGKLGFRAAQQLLGAIPIDGSDEYLDLGVVEVIAVDPFHNEELMRAWAEQSRDMSKIRYDGRDALSFLLDQGTSSANILVNALDGCVIPYDYAARVAEEAKRVIPLDGILLCSNSDGIEHRAREIFEIAFNGSPGRETFFSK
ncbi:hypothetical protein GOV09_07110 [Candidatus Woesearchaeota archaeon]|nr:hypothetical protein [Candidatus Woesearchaeota archaeon]